jgi:hypothetical protein
MRSRLVRRSIAAFTALVVALTLASAALWWQRRELLHWWSLRELARLGVAPARVEVARFDGSGLELRALRAGTGDALAIDAIAADYTLAELWRGRVSALRISGVRLTGEIGELGPRFGGLEALASGSRNAAAGGPRGEPPAPAGLRLPALPSNELRIESARAEIATAQGPLSVELSLNAQDRAGRTRARLDLVAHHALANATAVLDLEGADGALNGGAAVGVDLAPGAGLRLPFSAGRLAQSARLEVIGPEVLVSLAPGPFALTLGEGSQALRLEGSTPQARLRTQIGVDGGLAPFALTTTGGELRAEALGFAARGFELDLRLDPPLRWPAGQIAVLAVADTRQPPRAPGFALAGKLEPRDSALAFDLRATEDRHQVVLNARGTFDPETRSGEAQLAMPRIRFAKGGLQPAQLAPQLAGRLGSVVGSLEATGRARFAAGQTQLTLDVAGRDLGFETSVARVAGLNGTLRFEGPSPLSTPPGQLVSIARIGFGLDLTNGLIAGQLRPDGSVAIESAEWQILGGRVRTAGRIDPQATQQAFVLEAEALDLAQLLARIDLEGLSGEGRLDGSLPIARRGASLAIDHAVFRARPGGRLRYRPAADAASQRRRGASLDILLGAFENLALEKLEIELDGDANGKLQIALHVVGTNPTYQNGRPIHYNLSVESRLADLLRESATASGLPPVIEERLKRFHPPSP